jgi:hypothetical protein
LLSSAIEDKPELGPKRLDGNDSIPFTKKLRESYQELDMTMKGDGLVRFSEGST